MKLFINCLPRICWVILNTNLTPSPNFVVFDLNVLTKKHPSAEANPANQLGSKILGTSTKGLGTGIISGKAFPPRNLYL